MLHLGGFTTFFYVFLFFLYTFYFLPFMLHSKNKKYKRIKENKKNHQKSVDKALFLWYALLALEAVGQKGGRMDIRQEMVRYRAQNRLTIKQAAERCGISVVTWAYVERGLQEAKPVTMERIRLLIDRKEEDDEGID